MIPAVKHPTSDSGCLRVLVTRPRHQVAGFIKTLQLAGIQTFELPCIEIVFKDHHTLCTDQKTNSQTSDWWIFTSTNAVVGAYECQLLPPSKTAVKIATIGQATNRSLSEYKIPVDLAPVENSNSEQLLDLLKPHLKRGDKITIVRGDSGRDTLKHSLLNLGAEVNYLEVYQRQLPDITQQTATEVFTAAMPCVISITSDLVLSNLLKLLPTPAHQQLFGCPLVVNSKRCAQLAKQAGFSNLIKVASPPGDQGQLAALSSHS